MSTKTAPPTTSEIRLLLMELNASQQQMNRTMDALRARMETLLPREESPRAREFRRFTSKDWGRFLDGEDVATVKHRFRRINHNG